MDSVETNRVAMENALNGLIAEGDTALYDAIVNVIEVMNEEETRDRIRSVVLLSDGADTASTSTRQDAVEMILESKSGLNPIVLIPVAYGGDADISALSSLARASATKVQSGSTDDILTLLELISSYF
jgi:Mg-chelatase subunit ChlD